METKAIIILSITVTYFVVMSLIAVSVRKHANNSEGFTSGGKSFPAFLIAALLLSEFIGSSVSIGTAQTGFEVGISAAWNLIALALGFLFLGLLLAKKYRETGLNTISAILDKNYGTQTRYATSLLTIFALSTVTVALYASGGALIAAILDISRTTATILVGLVTVFYISIGGMRSIVYTNFINAAIKYIGMVLAVAFGLKFSGGLANLQANLPASMFSWSSIGFGQICSWMIAGIGSIFATQYIIQAITATENHKKAQRACYYVSSMMIPFGIMTAIAGICSAYLYPNIKSIDSLPELISNMPTLSAAVVVIGLAGAMLGGISANTMASATLLMKDFYDPFFNKEKNDKKSVIFIRIAVIVIGLLPLALALFAHKILLVAFLGKALRATLAVLILMCFFAPKFGTGKGAFYGIILSVFTTVGWFLLGNPYGIDSTYMAFAAPIITMLISHFGGGKRINLDHPKHAEAK
ncbi:sodium:solute symporter family protein [Acinetobacter sp. MD2(2019)]|uniref:sodium:solute symporter family protein n=1 Tax=Acinetobacter sp. MD2(2019) TaxID=2605273 RepID=UPI002D1EC968|nr:sodium:solute symporter family protein [Acinetobacter sp. MD2(2019)]MEB3753349.1 sodium:solute symporter family protein [Acinetobacter sp. MD2(2019)]